VGQRWVSLKEADAVYYALLFDDEQQEQDDGNPEGNDEGLGKRQQHLADTEQGLEETRVELVEAFQMGWLTGRIRNIFQAAAFSVLGFVDGVAVSGGETDALSSGILFGVSQ
jgi:hypothetical protein